MLVSKKKGVQYGLVKRGPGSQAAQAPPRKALAAFAEAEDDQPQAGGSVAGEVSRQAAKKQNDAKTAQMHAAALAADPSVFDYDGVYDSIQQQRVQPKQAEKVERKSRYIENLMDKAKTRQREQDIVYERRLAKERQAEDHLFGDKDRFVTAAYKEKLQEEQKWLAEEKVRELVEERDDVVKRGHMGDFYRNLMHNNVAFGTAQERSEKQPPSEEQQPEPDADASAEPASAEEPAAASASAPEDGAAAAMAAYRAKKEQPQAAPAQQDERPSAAPPDAGRPESSAALAPPALVQQPAEQQVAEQPPQEPEPDRETKAASARERYLARKRKAPDISGA